jgi:hypothetical protein
LSLAARLALACALFATIDARVAHAQTGGPVIRIAEGRVMRPGPGPEARPVPVAGQWVVLHRVGSDRAGPLDSVRSSPNGRFRIRYARSGAEDALYFVSSRYDGIAYFSPPLRADTIRGGDADVIVYNTTPDTSKLRVQGRHFVLSQARGGKRQVAEVYEIENEGTRTVVARDSTTPLWSTNVPVDAESLSVTPGDVTAGAVVFRQSRAEVYAPISPGVRQLVLTYLVPVKAFPLSQPVEHPVAVLEVLLEEPRAEVEGARLREVPPATIEGRTFRRFLGQDVPASAVIRVDAPPPVGQHRGALRVLAIVIALAMLSAIAVWYSLRRQRPSSVASRQPSDADRLIAELAVLDSRFEKDPSGFQDDEYASRRAKLKTRIERALAVEKAST